MTEFADKVVLVTGGSRGIGAAIARDFAERGAIVAILYRSDRAAAEAVAGRIVASGGTATVAQADVAAPEQVAQAVAQVAGRFGRLDILVNSAGIGPYLPLGEISEAHYRSVFDTNVLGTLMTIHAAAPHMPEGGRIVNLASRLAFSPLAGSAVYSASKAAVVSLTQTLARELGPRGITVNAVAPGVIETDMTTGIIATRGPGIVAQTPLGRIGQPDDIAGVVRFLASAEAKWITGRTLLADGGLT